MILLLQPKKYLIILININGNLECKKFVFLKEIFDNVTDNTVSSKFLETISYLQKAGAQVDFVDFGKALLLAILPTYMVYFLCRSNFK